MNFDQLQTTVEIPPSSIAEKPSPQRDDNSIRQKKQTGTKLEKYAYYAYSFANSGLGPFGYSALLFQNLIYQAGFDPTTLPLGSQPCGDDATAQCHVFWAGGTKSYTSVVNLSLGITFLGQALLFILLGATADYGTWSPWILRLSTVVCCALQLGYLGVDTATTWPAAMALYILSNISFALLYAFFVALFPKIAADQPRALKAVDDRKDNVISASEADMRQEIERSKIMNHSWVWNNVGFAVGACLCLAALKGLNADASVANNNLGYSVCTALLAGFTLAFSIPWFCLDRGRPGKLVPRGTNIVALGLRNYWKTLTKARKLPQTFSYLVIYFFLNDAVTTLMTQIIIVQTSAALFSATTNTYFIIIQGLSSAIFPYVAAWVQDKFSLKTKTILHLSNAGCLFLAVWGVVGSWTTSLGYHNQWEFWALSCIYGAALGVQWSYALAFMGELVPKGDENQFFSLLGVVSRGGAWIGPVVSSALIDRTGNSWVPFGFIAAMIFLSSVMVIFVDEEKGRMDCDSYMDAK